MRYFRDILALTLGALTLYVVSLGTNLHLRINQAEKNIVRIDTNVMQIVGVMNKLQPNTLATSTTLSQPLETK